MAGIPGESGCGQSELGEKSMKHRRILKYLTARAVSQHACTLLSDFIGTHPTWSLTSSIRGEKKCNRKTKTNQNTADCSMLPVGLLEEGGKKKEITSCNLLGWSPSLPMETASTGERTAAPLPVLCGKGPDMGWGTVPAPHEGPRETLRWQLMPTALQLHRLWPK